jgi:hypothetical protein
MKQPMLALVLFAFFFAVAVGLGYLGTHISIPDPFAGNPGFDIPMTSDINFWFGVVLGLAAAWFVFGVVVVARGMWSR